MSQICVELQEFMGSDRSIAEAAWTSSSTLEAKTKRTDEDVARVVKMLIEQKHASPIESVVLRFWIKMPIAIDRQHMTHRVASHNGMSGRYRTMPSEFYEMPEDVKSLLVKAFPYSIDGKEWINEYDTLCERANSMYQLLMSELKYSKNENNINNDEYKRLREFYRGVLPQHNMTERVTLMNLRSFCNYQKLRNNEHAQVEICKVAELMLKAVEDANVCPIALSVFKEHGWNI